MKTVGERLRALREHEGLTIKQMAWLCGMTDTGMGLIERGQNVPNGRTTTAICMAFEVPADWLLGTFEGVELLSVMDAKHIYSAYCKVVDHAKQRRVRQLGRELARLTDDPV